MSAVKTLCNSLLQKSDGTAADFLANMCEVQPATLEQPGRVHAAVQGAASEAAAPLEKLPSHDVVGAEATMQRPDETAT